MAIDNYQGKKFCGNNSFNVDDNLTVEQALQININNQSFTLTMRTPGNDLDLIRGLLYSEDIYKNDSDLNILITEDQEKNITEANIIIEPGLIGSGYLIFRVEL